MRFPSTLAITVTLLAGSVLAHPGQDESHEIEERAAFMKSSKRDLSHCAEKMKARGLEDRSIRRRAALAKSLRKKRSLNTRSPYKKIRDVDAALNTTHLSSVDYTPFSEEDVIFSGNSSCILSPEVTEGPYYASGEYIRRNLIEDQNGVELVVDLQVIDMDTCEPVVNAMIDFWHCNSTGVYSGVVANGNGDSTDESNLNATFLRGLQPTQYDGVAQFTTLFPGHYTGRTSHIHVLAHLNGTILPNATYTGGTVSHVGQIFFDQSLISQVEATAPYISNTQDLTTNAQDGILAQEAASSDPFVQYSLLGDSVEDGIFAWIAFGVDLTQQQNVTPAVVFGAGGGVVNPNAGSGCGGNGTGPPPSGAVPSGPFASGSATSVPASSSSSSSAA